MTRTLNAVENDIEEWIAVSSIRFDAQFSEQQKVWVLKYFSPAFLGGFLKRKDLVISTSPGFTWGDGVYVTPLATPYSTMMYGRIGVLGWISNVPALRAYDAADPHGIRLYQEWITYSSYLYRLLTTTIHADRANRLLRNAFRRKFRIDVTFFRPDQYNRNYVSLSQDQWLVISDWAGLGAHAPAQAPSYSSRVTACEWVAVVAEQFQESRGKTHFLDLIGPHLHRTGYTRLSNQALAAQLRQNYTITAGGGPMRIAHILA